MPNKPPKVCARAGCPEKAYGRFCATHQAEYDRQRNRESNARRPSSAAQGYGRRWRKISQIIRRQRPICEECGRAPSTQVDHVISKAEGGDDSPSNLRALCASCHSKKTCREDGGWGRAKQR